MPFFVYAHYRPDGRPFYVGKGSGTRYRVSKRGIHYNGIIKKYGADNIGIEIRNCCSEDAAYELEVRLIKEFKDAGYKLANKNLGGKGQSVGVRYPEDHGRKISASKMGHPVSQEQIEKQRKKMLGRKQSAEAKAKQIAAQTGRKLPGEWKENARNGLLKYFEEKRQKGESLKQSEDLIEKRRQGMLRHYENLRKQGKKRQFSEESKAKMRASRLAYLEKKQKTSN